MKSVSIAHLLVLTLIYIGPASSDSLTSSLPVSPIKTLDKITKPLNKTRLKTKSIVDPAETLQSIASDPLSQLPAKLPIVNNLGVTLFNEVAVENGERAIEREWILLLSESDRVHLESLNIEIIKQNQFAQLGLTLLHFKVPANIDSYQQLELLLPAELFTRLGRNHVYASQSETSAEQKGDLKVTFEPTIHSPKSFCEAPLKIGMIDTAIEQTHEAFKDQKLTASDFIGETLVPPKAHGTAVAGLLIGAGMSLDGELVPLLPKAQLYAASVFYARNHYSQGATLLNLVSALNWLVEQQVLLINMSLTGPDNPILKIAIQQTLKQQIMIVAAAGNEGPASPELYPAAYQGVVTATAVDIKDQIYRWANQGQHIDFVALGVQVITARGNGDYGLESGTSIAAPVISAALACEKYASAESNESLLNRLQQQAIDLGDTGKDDVYGYGLIRR